MWHQAQPLLILVSHPSDKLITHLETLPTFWSLWIVGHSSISKGDTVRVALAMFSVGLGTVNEAHGDGVAEARGEEVAEVRGDEVTEVRGDKEPISTARSSVQDSSWKRRYSSVSRSTTSSLVLCSTVLIFSTTWKCVCACYRERERESERERWVCAKQNLEGFYLKLDKHNRDPSPDQTPPRL